MEKATHTHHHDHDHTHMSMHCVSWSAIVFGAIVATALGFLFNIFSLAVGLTAFPVSPEGKAQFAAWGYLGLIVISIITMFVAGWLAGYLGREFCTRRGMGEILGFGAWAVALILTIFLASQAGEFLNQRSYTVDRSGSPFQLVNQLNRNVNQAADMAQRPTSADTQDTQTVLGITSFATFFLLFIGALSSTFGGRVGSRHKVRGHTHCH